MSTTLLTHLRGWITARFRPHSQHPERHLVLDLDETLVHTFHGLGSLNNLKLQTVPDYVGLRPRIYILQDGMWGITRPFFDTFVESCFRQFSTVTIWSAGTESYVTEVVGKIFPSLPAPDLVMTRRDCWFSEGNYKKPLALVHDYFEMMGRRDLNVNETNTLMVEDRAVSMIPCDMDNTIIVPPYDPEAKFASLMREDPALGILSSWFDGVEFRHSLDVRRPLRPYFYTAAIPQKMARTPFFPSYSASRSFLRAPTMYY